MVNAAGIAAFTDFDKRNDDDWISELNVSPMTPVHIVRPFDKA